MNHSLRAYLERRSTEELDTMLQYYLVEDRWLDYVDAIMEILDVLHEREKNVSYEITPQIQAAMELYLERIRKMNTNPPDEAE